MVTPRCFLDLDGVLVDFVRGVQEFHKVTLPYESVRWGLEAQMGFGDRKNEFWAPLGYEFWANLPWTQDGKEILDSVRVVFGANIGILSSPCSTLGCCDGKRDWVRRNLGADLHRTCFLGADKSIFANPHSLLIDDNDDNVRKWREAGGAAILWPRPWNDARNWEGIYDPGESNLRFDIARWCETFDRGRYTTPVRATCTEHTPGILAKQQIQPGGPGVVRDDRSRA